MNKYLSVLAASILLGGGAYWYFTPMPEPVTGSAAPAAFVLTEIGISLGTVNGWDCTKRQSHIAHPNWIQLTCYAGGASGDPYMALNNVPVDGSETFSVEKKENVLVDGKTVVETIYRTRNSSSDYGVVEYLYIGATQDSSFEAIFPFGIGKPHASASVASAVGRMIMQSITFYDIARNDQAQTTKAGGRNDPRAGLSGFNNGNGDFGVKAELHYYDDTSVDYAHMTLMDIQTAERIPLRDAAPEDRYFNTFFFKDKRHVFFKDQVINDVDIASFVAVNIHCAYDKLHTYWFVYTGERYEKMVTTADRCTERPPEKSY